LTLKLFDRRLHEKYTGKSNELILENLALITASGKPLIVRLPLITGCNRYRRINLGQIAEISLKAGVKEINLEPYNHLVKKNI